MRITKRTINNLPMESYNDSNVDWVVQSTDKDGEPRTERYERKTFTQSAAFEFHAKLYSEM
ncbi:hypothetical protein [Vibrio crassostreae]|uniref:hypothetical protein n=1 Tax=Vibrio crassostreae TaxID=246167 RepID=UPI001B318302|nr:hypothetical protein [Vibrio crassostreae]